MLSRGERRRRGIGGRRGRQRRMRPGRRRPTADADAAAAARVARHRLGCLACASGKRRATERTCRSRDQRPCRPEGRRRSTRCFEGSTAAWQRMLRPGADGTWRGLRRSTLRTGTRLGIRTRAIWAQSSRRHSLGLAAGWRARMGPWRRSGPSLGRRARGRPTLAAATGRTGGRRSARAASRSRPLWVAPLGAGLWRHGTSCRGSARRSRSGMPQRSLVRRMYCMGAPAISNPH